MFCVCYPAAARRVLIVQHHRQRRLLPLGPPTRLRSSPPIGRQTDGGARTSLFHSDHFPAPRRPTACRPTAAAVLTWLTHPPSVFPSPFSRLELWSSAGGRRCPAPGTAGEEEQRSSRPFSATAAPLPSPADRGQSARERRRSSAIHCCLLVAAELFLFVPLSGVSVGYAYPSDHLWPLTEGFINHFVGSSDSLNTLGYQEHRE